MKTYRLDDTTIECKDGAGAVCEFKLPEAIAQANLALRLNEGIKELKLYLESDEDEPCGIRTRVLRMLAWCTAAPAGQEE